METQNTTFNYAGFWKRLAASIIDSLVISVSGLFIGFILVVLYDILVGKAGFAGFADDYISSFFISIFLLAWVYPAAMESSIKQATLGKMALGIIVTDLSGKRVSFGKASGRIFGKILSGFIFDIGFFMIGFTARKQGLHDMMAGCLVINKHLV